MSTHCAVRDGTVYEGTRMEIVLQVVSFFESTGDGVRYQIPGFPPESRTYDTSAWKHNAMVKDACLHIFESLSRYDYRLYERIRF